VYAATGFISWTYRWIWSKWFDFFAGLKKPVFEEAGKLEPQFLSNRIGGG